MIWQVWALLVLVGSGSAYLAFVPKRAPVFTSLATIGTFSVAALGATNLRLYSHGTAYQHVEMSVAILCALTACTGAIVFLAAITGQYGETDEDDEPMSGFEDDDERSGGALDKIAGRMH